MKDLDRINKFPPAARLFAFVFTTLMLLVCLWAVWIYTVEKGEVDRDNLPAYMADNGAASAGSSDGESKDLRRNLGLAHTHVNGQTLLFFALGLLFLFTSVGLKTKKRILWTFGITILVHTVGLSGEGFHWIFDDLLAISGVLLLILIAYMCLMIYVDLGRKKPETSR